MIKNIKKKIEAWQEEFIWFPLRGAKVFVEENEGVYEFTDKGIILKEKNTDIEYMLNEMFANQLIQCYRLLNQMEIMMLSNLDCIKNLEEK